ncbi:hypothetical protein IMY05_C4888000100 [Salix suchowensis]|nr:hypothetical protein IMY05_C4888000100 [Salix suchowensis]
MGVLGGVPIPRGWELATAKGGCVMNHRHHGSHPLLHRGNVLAVPERAPGAFLRWEAPGVVRQLGVLGRGCGLACEGEKAKATEPAQHPSDACCPLAPGVRQTGRQAQKSAVFAWRVDEGVLTASPYRRRHHMAQSARHLSVSRPRSGAARPPSYTCPWTQGFLRQVLLPGHPSSVHPKEDTLCQMGGSPRLSDIALKAAALIFTHLYVKPSTAHCWRGSLLCRVCTVSLSRQHDVGRPCHPMHGLPCNVSYKSGEMCNKILDTNGNWQKKIVEWLEGCHVGEFLTGTQEEVEARTAKSKLDSTYVDHTLHVPEVPPYTSGCTCSDETWCKDNKWGKCKARSHGSEVYKSQAHQEKENGSSSSKDNSDEPEQDEMDSVMLVITMKTQKDCCPALRDQPCILDYLPDHPLSSTHKCALMMEKNKKLSSVMLAFFVPWRSGKELKAVDKTGMKHFLIKNSALLILDL